MNFLSINIKGAGNSDKANWISRLKKDHGISLIGIQETMFSSGNRIQFSKFWGDSNLEVDWVDANGRSGGIATLWDPCLIFCTDTFKDQNFLMITRNVMGIDGLVNVINVYAPQTSTGKREPWRAKFRYLNNPREVIG
ncbi:putative Endonuclease/exonuclease/phosphatase superfamily [Helianthus annuus]|nr:putative Endonuclease/exonuclease/phosphatase superfamily [Helianthus annuus]